MDVRLSKSYHGAEAISATKMQSGIIMVYHVTARGNTYNHLELTPDEALKFAAVLIAEANRND